MVISKDPALKEFTSFDWGVWIWVQIVKSGGKYIFDIERQAISRKREQIFSSVFFVSDEKAFFFKFCVCTKITIRNIAKH